MNLLQLSLLVFGVSVLFTASAQTQPTSTSPVSALQEQRYCGPPVRLADGSIRRRSDVLAAFRKEHPCPVTGQSLGACPGWQMDHVIPLACGGCDAVSNLQWLPKEIKTCTADTCKDRFEQKLYCRPAVKKEV